MQKKKKKPREGKEREIGILFVIKHAILNIVCTHQKNHLIKAQIKSVYAVYVHTVHKHNNALYRVQRVILTRSFKCSVSAFQVQLATKRSKRSINSRESREEAKQQKSKAPETQKF
jgi:hypothetical protein